jgi:hypothetical protein
MSSGVAAWEAFSAGTSPSEWAVDRLKGGQGEQETKEDSLVCGSSAPLLRVLLSDM